MKKWTKITLAALATLLILSGTDARAADPPTSCGGNWPVPMLIAEWNFDAEYTEDGFRYTPMTASDLIVPPSGPLDPINIYPGKIMNATWVNGPSGFGKAYQFSRSNQQEIELTNRFLGLGYDYQNNFNFDITDKFTIAVWVKYTTNFDFGSIVSKMITDNDESYRGWCLGAGTQIPTINNKGGIRFHLINNWTSNAIWIDTKLGYGDNQWHYVVATYDGTQNASGMKIYVDGVEAQVTKNGGISATSEGSAKVMFGNRDADPNNRQFVGCIDEVQIFCGVYNDQIVLGELFPYPPVLWLNSHQIGIIQANNTAVSNWDDIADLVFEEDAKMTETLRLPQYNNNSLNGFPGVTFTYDYGATKYGYSDILVSQVHDEITTGNTDRWNPTAQDKSLLVLFKTNTAGFGSNPYYSDGRQTICEFGGPLSGFNIYIQNGMICAGMWNRYQMKYLVYNPPPGTDWDYPMDPNRIYLAHLEYKAADKEFRLVMSQGPKTSPVAPAGTSYSPLVTGFDGFTRDAEDQSGIGGASRTRYHDYSTGETYSDHFGGVISEVLLFNKFFTPTEAQEVYDYLVNKYGFGWTWTYPAANAPKEGEWIVIDKTEPKPEFELSEAVPNPFSERASFRVNIDEAQEIEVELINAVGSRVQSIYSGSIGAGIREFTVDGSQLPQGVYFYRVRGETINSAGKLILAK